MMIKTRISEMLEVDYPLVFAGPAGGSSLAVSAAKEGGIGFVEASAFATREELKKELEEVNSLTRGTFGVTIDLSQATAAGFIDTAAAAGARSILTTGGEPADWSAKLKKAGTVWVHRCTSLELAVQAEKLGAKAVVLAEGRGGESPMSLIPRAVERLGVPIITGGPASGGGLIAVLALGAEGIQVDPTALALPLTAAVEEIVRGAVRVQKKLTQLCLYALAQSAPAPDSITYVFPDA